MSSFFPHFVSVTSVLLPFLSLSSILSSLHSSSLLIPSCIFYLFFMFILFFFSLIIVFSCSSCSYTFLLFTGFIFNVSLYFVLFDVRFLLSFPLSYLTFYRFPQIHFRLFIFSLVLDLYHFSSPTSSSSSRWCL